MRPRCGRKQKRCQDPFSAPSRHTGPKKGPDTFSAPLRVSAYVLVTFGPTSAATFAQAQDILVNFRIPHHARPDLWLDAVAVLPVAWVVLALLFVWQTRLFPVPPAPYFPVL